MGVAKHCQAFVDSNTAIILCARQCHFAASTAAPASELAAALFALPNLRAREHVNTEGKFGVSLTAAQRLLQVRVEHDTAESHNGA